MDLLVRSSCSSSSLCLRKQINSLKSLTAYSWSCLVALFVLTLLSFGSQEAAAQNVHYSGAVSAVGSGFTGGPFGVAVDASGNVFVLEQDTGKLSEILAGTGGAASGRVNANSTVNVVGGGFSSAYGVAVDASGDLFVSDTNNGLVKEIVAGTGGAASGTINSSSTVKVVGSGISNPHGLAVDVSGNVFVANMSSNKVWEIVAGTGANGGSCVLQVGKVNACSTVVEVGSGFSQPSDVAVDGSGNVFVADYGHQEVKEIVAVSGVVTSSSTVNIIGDNGNFSGPSNVAVDASGNVFVADNAVAVKEIVAGTGGAAAGKVTLNSTVNTLGSGFGRPFGIAVEASGNLIVADYLNSVVDEVTPGTVNFGSVASGLVTPPTQTLTFTFTGSGAIGGVSVQSPGGTYGGQDFIDTLSGTCDTNPVSTNYNIGDSCTVVVKFTPQMPGLRVGAVQLNSTGGSTIATGRISGMGLVPLLAYPNMSYVHDLEGMGTVNRGLFGVNGASLDQSENARGVALGPYGNLYLSQTANHTVTMFVAGTGNTAFGPINYASSQLSIPSSGGRAFVTPEGLAVDFFGNVFVADPGRTEKVLKVVGSTETQVGHGFGNVHHIAVDTSGNLWVADTDNNAVKEVMAGLDGSVDINSTVNTVGSGFKSPYGIAVDVNGNVFVSDSDGVKEIVAGTGGATIKSINNILGSNTGGLSLDAFGNLFVASTAGGNVLAEKIFAGSSGTVNANSDVSVIAFTGSVPSWDVAVDSSGYLFILDQLACVNLSCPYAINAAVDVMTYETAPTLTFPSTIDGATSHAVSLNDPVGNTWSLKSITVVNTGSAPLVFSAPNVSSGFAIDTSTATTCPLVSGTLAVNATCTYSALFTPTSGMNGAVTGTLTIHNNAAPGHQSVPLSGTAAIPVAEKLEFTTPPPATIAVGGNAGIVKVSVTDYAGNVAYSTSGIITLYVSGPTGPTAYEQYANGGVATFDLSSVPLNTAYSYAYTAAARDNGTCTIIATDTSSCLPTIYVYENVIGTSFTAPTEPAGTPSGAQTATLIFNSNTTLNSDLATAIQVLTLGAPNKDFVYAAGGTCAAGATYSAGQSCTVSYTFTPKYPGQRLGAIVLYDNSAPPVQVGFIHLSGMGTGPMVTFPSNTTAIPVGSSFSNPVGAVVDGSGNIFVADSDTNSVKEIVAVNGAVSISSTVNTVASGFTSVRGLALDGAGNLFVADEVSNTVSEVVAVGGVVSSSSPVITVSSGFKNPWGLAVDANGNVFVADRGNSAVKEIVAAGGIVSSSSVVNTVGKGFSDPFGLAVDANGNVFVADNAGKAVKEIMAVNGIVSSNSTVNLLGTGAQYYAPKALVLDASGDVIVLDNGSSTLFEIVAGTGGAGTGTVNATSTVNVLIGGLGNPYSLTMGANGNLFIAEIGDNTVKEFDLSDAPSLTFASTLNGATSSTQTVTVANSGNASLIFPKPGTGSNPSIANYFTLDSTGTTACPPLTASSSTYATLAPGASCTLPISFAPVDPAFGNVSGPLNLFDNSLNLDTGMQSISLNATVAVPITAFTITAYPSTVQAGNGSSFTVTAINGANVSTNYTGSVTFTSSDAKASFSPSSYTFTIGDAGVHTFTNGAYLHTVGNQTITASDTSAHVSQTSSAIAVTTGTPSGIGASGGSGQSALIGAAFTNPLRILVSDSWGNPVSGITVSFTAPSTGASATLSTNGTVVTASDGTASLTATANSAAGSYSVTARPDAPSGVSASFALTNSQATPTVTLVPSPASPIAYGQAGTSLGATVTYTTGTPSGSVVFSDGSTQLGSALPLSSGTATFAAQYYAVGTHTFKAAYGGDANYNVPAPATASYLVNKASSTLTGPSTQPVFVVYQNTGAIPVSVTGQYSGAGIAAPTGSISYSISLGSTQTSSGVLTIANGTVSVPVANTLAPGIYSVALAYTGDTNYGAATAINVSLQVGQIQPTIDWTAPSPIAYGTTLNGLLNAAAMNSSATVQGTYAYTATPAGGSPSAVTNASILPAGTYTLSVSFTPTDSQTYKTATGNGTLVVNKVTPGVSASSNFNPVLSLNSITLTATVNSTVSTPTGTVTFLDGMTPIGAGGVNASGAAMLSLSTLAVGSHNITAVYSGDANFNTATSSALPQLVQDFNLTISIATSGGTAGVTSVTSLPGGTATYTFTLSPVGAATFPAIVTLSASGLPTGATYTFSPATLAAGAGATQVTLTINLPQVSAAVQAPALRQTAAPVAMAQNKPASKLPLLALALLLLPFTRRMRIASRKLGRLLPLLLLLVSGLAAITSMSGCGGKASGYFGQAPAAYAITVTGTSGALTHSTSVTLTVE